jgi:hypothetical protein
LCLRRIFLLTERDGSSTVSQRGGRTTVFFLTSQVFFLPKIHREAEEIQCPSYRVTTESQCSFYLVSVFFLPRNNRESEEIQCPSYRVAVLFLPRIHREAEELQCSSYQEFTERRKNYSVLLTQSQWSSYREFTERRKNYSFIVYAQWGASSHVAGVRSAPCNPSRYTDADYSSRQLQRNVVAVRSTQPLSASHTSHLKNCTRMAFSSRHLVGVGEVHVALPTICPAL